MSNAPARTHSSRSGRPSHPGARSGRRPPPNRNVTALAIGLVVVLAAVSIVVGLAARSGNRRSAVAQTRSVEVTGLSLPPFVPGGLDAAAGRLVPEVRGEGFDGSPLEIRRDGTPKLVIFVAHWCPHCQAEVPGIVRWVGSGQPPGVQVVAVSSSADPSRPNYPPSAWLERSRWTIPTIADNAAGGAAVAFGLTGYPFFVAVNAQGTVSARMSGELTVVQLDALAAAARGSAALPG